MNEKEKLSGIENYLKELFPGYTVEYIWDAKSHNYMFHINTPLNETRHTIGISSKFITDNDPEDIVISLKLDNLMGYLQIFGKKEVWVTSDGINPQGIRPRVME